MGDLRSGGDWRRARAQVLASATVCWLCGRPLDFGAPARSPMSPSVDHVVPLKTLAGVSTSTRRRVALSLSFLRAAHYGCNSRRGARPVPAERVKVSRRW
jgi:5-methylcytosine-specific restriction endonuclease McrA